VADKFDNEEKNGTSVATDKDGIPILDEVVDSDRVESTSQPAAPQKGQGLNLPDRTALLVAMRKQLSQQIESELQMIAQQIAATTAKKLSASIERVLWKELQCALGDQLDKMQEKSNKSAKDGTGRD
jgi:hypothetical protein